MTEYQLHRAVVQYLNHLNPECIWYHVNNNVRASGGYARRTGKQLKELGVRAGVPDLCFVLPDTESQFAGTAAFIELKIEGGRQNDNQKLFERDCIKYCAPYVVCRSVDDVKETLEEWGVI